MRKKNVLMVMVAAAAFLMLSGAGQAFEPIGYPWLTWGELSEAAPNRMEQGLKLDFYLEQGIDWFKVDGWRFDTFVGLRGTLSDQPGDYWNNKGGPQVGFKFRKPIQLFQNSWGLLSIGARMEQYNYLVSSPHNDETRGVVFIQWGFGGDWKKK